MVKKYVAVWRGDYYDGYLWYPSHEDGLLLKIDVTTGQVDYVLSMLMPEEGLPHAYHQIIASGDGILWAIPGWGDKLLRIDLKSGEQRLIDIPDSYVQQSVAAKFTGSIRYQKEIICFPGSMGYIMTINTDTAEVAVHRDVVKEINAMCGKELPVYFSWGTVCRGDKIYAISGRANIMLEWDLGTKQYTLSRLCNEENIEGFVGIEVCGDELYVTNQEFHVRVYDLCKKQFKKRIETEKRYALIKKCNDKILLIPVGTDEYAFGELNANVLSEIPYPVGQACALWNENFMKDIVEVRENYYIMSMFSNMLIKVDKESQDVQFIPLSYGKTLLDWLKKDSGECFKEGTKGKNFASIGLEDLFKYVTT